MNDPTTPVDLGSSLPPALDPEAILVSGVVAVAGEVKTRSDPNTFAAWSSWTLVGTEGPFQILSNDPGRAVARILVSGTGPLYVGSREQCQTAGFVGAALIPTGTGWLEYTAAPAVWAVPDGSHSVTITVINERSNRV
jgi:hypothetical protein